MKPPMRNEVTVHVPIFDEEGQLIIDKYGKPKTKPINSKARVQFKSQLIRDANGQEKKVTLEVDLPNNIDVQDGTEIEYVNIGGKKTKGTVVAKEEAVNLAGSKVYYRTVYVDG